MDTAQFVSAPEGAGLADPAVVAPGVQEPPTEEIDIGQLIADKERLEQQFGQTQRQLQQAQQQVQQFTSMQMQQAQQAWDREFQTRVAAVHGSDLPVDVQAQQLDQLYRERDQQRQQLNQQLLGAVAHQVALSGYADKAIAEFGIPPEYKQHLLTVSHPDLIPYKAQEIRQSLDLAEQQRKNLESQRAAQQAQQRVASGAHVLESSRPGTAPSAPTYEPGSVAHMAAVLAGAG